MATIIRKSSPPVRTFKIGEHISFIVWVPLQNIGMGTEIRMGNIVKINRKTIDVLDGNGNTWRVGMDEVRY